MASLWQRALRIEAPQASPPRRSQGGLGAAIPAPERYRPRGAAAVQPGVWLRGHGLCDDRDGDWNPIVGKLILRV